MNAAADTSVAALPGDLPAGEHVIWQGVPERGPFTRRLFHVGAIAVYFAALMTWRAGSQVADGASLPQAAASVLWLAPVAAGCIGVLMLLGRLYARTTCYTITNRRIAIRFGAALSKTINIPLKLVAAASCQTFADGTADVALRLIGPDRPLYFALWPHVRPWRILQAQPALRSVPDGARVAALLADALQAVHREAAPVQGGSRQSVAA